MASIDFKKNDTYRRRYEGILQIKGSAASVEELQKLSPSAGDIYFIGNGNVPYFFDGSTWGALGSSGSEPQIISFLNAPSELDAVLQLSEAVENGTWKNSIVEMQYNDETIIHAYIIGIERSSTPKTFSVDARTIGNIMSIAGDSAIYRWLSSINEWFVETYGESIILDHASSPLSFIFANRSLDSTHSEYGVFCDAIPDGFFTFTDSEKHPYIFEKDAAGEAVGAVSLADYEISTFYYAITQEEAELLLGYPFFLGQIIPEEPVVS